MDYTVSVIVTCYNHEKYIESCLLSIFEQTYSNIELYVIDDGSSDNSIKIIRDTLKKSPFEKTVLLTQENLGVCFTRNRGLDNANGDFVLIVDSDDFLTADYIEKLLNQAIKTQGDIIYCDLWDFEGKQFQLEAKEFSLETFLERNYIINTSLIRKSVIGNIRYDLELNRKFLEDYDFMMRLVLENGAKPVYAKGVHLNYRVLQDSISRQANHDTEIYYYGIYCYILKKHISKFPNEIMEAINRNLNVQLERIEDLILHLDDVTKHVNNLEAIKAKSDDNIKCLLEHNAQLLKENEQLSKNNHRLYEDTQSLLNSRSYRLGNSLMKPAFIAKKIYRNPKLIKKGAKDLLSKSRHYIGKIPKPQKYLFKGIRSFQRKNNNYSSPKRFLIYVIYENQESIQEYKILFLDALAKLCDEVLVVVNGNISQEDQARLLTYGRVILRSNDGYDTAAFREGILSTGKEHLLQFDELLLVNDTNVGPFADLDKVFKKMSQQRLDFWGMTYGEKQQDITGYNPYGYIPLHLQSYFLVIEKSLFSYDGFYAYWKDLNDTNSREKAVGYHETVFTKHFSDLGFKHGAVTNENKDSAMYIHPLKMLQAGVPLVKYTAFANYNDDKFLWQGLNRKTELPQLLEYLEKSTDYPMGVIDQVMNTIKEKERETYILIIDGVENIIPQCTRYRVLNKAEQLRSFGYKVKVVNNSEFQLKDAEYASLVIIYRCGYSPLLERVCELSKQFNKTVLYDIDDLVIDTKYTDQLDYTKKISLHEKANYDANVMGYGRMLEMCDGAITSTSKLKSELENYQDLVLLNRNLASRELVEISDQVVLPVVDDAKKVKIGYFSGSITHNENFELIESDIFKILEEYPQVELHLVGHLDIPEDLKRFKEQLVTHDYVDWLELPHLIREVDINLAPLCDTLFNQAKSEIKWIEASLVKVPTIASNIGSFKEMIKDKETGVLANDEEWYESLVYLIESQSARKEMADKAYSFVLANCTTIQKNDELVRYMYDERI